MSSSPVRVTESSRNYGYNPSPVKPEGLRRPPSKTSMHQSRRLVASAQANPDVSDLSQAVPCPASCLLSSVSKGTSSRVIKSITMIAVGYFLISLVLTSCLILLHPASNLTIVSTPSRLTVPKSRDSKGPFPFTWVFFIHIYFLASLGPSCCMWDLPSSLQHGESFLVAVCGIQFPYQGSMPGPLCWECGIPATGPPGSPSPFILIPSFHPSASSGYPDPVQQHRK